MKIYTKIRLSILFIFVFSTIQMLIAQPEDHVWLETSKLKVRVNADGRLFCDGDGGFFIKDGDQSYNIARGAGLWFAGLDRGRNFWFAGQPPFPGNKTDFLPGLKGIPNSGKIWKVTREEIEAHLKDYREDFVVDHPIPAIFAWPAYGNPHGYAYNQFDAPRIPTLFEFVDVDADYRYTPERGDYPVKISREWGYNWEMPSQMASFDFYTDTFSQIAQYKKALPLQVKGTAHVYDCSENELLSSSFFVDYEYQNLSGENLDSVYLSLCNDMNIGGETDDYIGWLPEHHTLYYYNKAGSDAVFGDKSPLVFITILQSSLNHSPLFEYEDSLYLPQLMPFSQPEIMNGKGFPTAYNECYNYMTGTWRDGTPLSTKRSGYNPGISNAPYAGSAFPGYPDTPGAWTEWNEHTDEGDRSAMVNMRLPRLNPGDIGGLSLQFSFMPWKEGTLTERIKAWEKQEDDMIGHLNTMPQEPGAPSYYCPFDFIEIFKKPDALSVFPNPADRVVKIWHPKTFLKKMVLYDALGRLVGIGNYQKEYSEIDVSNLPDGVYFLDTETESGEKKVAKIIVKH